MNQYKISNNEIFKDFIILRFIYNDKSFSNNIKLLNDLKKQVLKDEDYYNTIYPWNDILEKNKEIIIVYNKETNNIHGWCNIEYGTFSNGDIPTEKYYLKVDKLVTREIPKIKYIGLLILCFIRDECINKPIIYNNKKINIDIMYLYSVTNAINYYKNTFLTQLSDNNEIYKHVFIYLNPKYINIITKKIRDYINQLNILHLFECDFISSIPKYNKNKRNINNKRVLLSNINEYDYNIKDFIYKSRKKIKLF